MWTFDVFSSTHDLLKEGKIEPFHSILVLSSKEFPDFHDAYLTAQQWGCKNGLMTTRVDWKL